MNDQHFADPAAESAARSAQLAAMAASILEALVRLQSQRETETTRRLLYTGADDRARAFVADSLGARAFAARNGVPPWVGAGLASDVLGVLGVSDSSGAGPARSRAQIIAGEAYPTPIREAMRTAPAALARATGVSPQTPQGALLRRGQQDAPKPSQGGAR